MIKHKPLLVILILLCSSVGQSQSIFKIPTAETKYEDYKSIDDCLTAYSRLHLMWSTIDTVWRDTAAFDSLRFYQKIPKSSADIIKRCISKFDFDTLPMARAGEWITLLLASNRDVEAKKIYTKWVNTKEGGFYGPEFRVILHSLINSVPTRNSMIADLYDVHHQTDLY